MISTQDRERLVGAVIRLGSVFSKGQNDTENTAAVEAAYLKNQWFIPRFVWEAIAAWARELTEENIRRWVEAYPLAKESKKVGLILAGNIPLVGLHDVLAGYLSGHILHIKLSSQDDVLMMYVISRLKSFSPEDAHRLCVVSSLRDVDAVVATGSDNTARYFEYYFRDKPMVIRHSRTSVAVVDDVTSDEELSLLADDVMMYWGRGCRSISRVFFPEGYDIGRFIKALSRYSWVADYHYYRNNYDYQRAIYTMSGKKDVYDTGFLLLSMEDNLLLPTGVVAYDFYKDKSSVEAFVERYKDGLQCVEGRGVAAAVEYGKSQSPSLTDYADGVDTMKFFAHL